MNKNFKIGFVGAGNMAQAIGLGLIKSGISGKQITASAPSAKNLKPWTDVGALVTNDNNEVIQNSDVVFLCMKPQYLKSAVDSFNELPDSKIYVSILAGISLELLQKMLSSVPGTSNNLKIVRVVPNTPVMVKAGCSVMSANALTSEAELKLVQSILCAGGCCEIVPEHLLNSISAVSGSGPAFIYMVIEALADGAVLRGVPRDLALRMAARMVEGAGKMVAETGKHPGQLKDEVCSPGGTTITGVQKLEAAGVRHAFMSAVQAAGERADTLASLVKM